MPQSCEYREYHRIMGVLASGGPEELTSLSREIDSFPNGVDGFIGRQWITNAIDCGSKLAVEWMIGRGVDLNFRDDEGYTVLHAALERRHDERQEVLRALLAAGARVNAFGVNGWTPAHMAAAHEDIEALKLLIEYDADLTIRTEIDYYSTPLEEARRLGKQESVRFLEGHSPP